MATSALVSLLTIVLLACLVYGPWQWVCTDFARQILFEKRDAIFDMAAAGELDFRSREYRTIRSSLEKCIRFAHELTLPRFLVLRLSFFCSGQLRHKSELQQAVEAIAEPGPRGKVEHLIFEAQVALIIMMFVKSPVAIVLAPVVAIPLCLVSLAAQLLHIACGGFGNLARLGEIVQVEAENAPSASKVPVQSHRKLRWL